MLWEGCRKMRFWFIGMCGLIILMGQACSSWYWVIFSNSLEWKSGMLILSTRAYCLCITISVANVVICLCSYIWQLIIISIATQCWLMIKTLTVRELDLAEKKLYISVDYSNSDTFNYLVIFSEWNCGICWWKVFTS